MNLKEFDAKQFLLEKGERVGLGVAVTLMVLMLIFSLFMPSRGFFSGSPSKNAEVLESGSKQLQTALEYRATGTERSAGPDRRSTDRSGHRATHAAALRSAGLV